MTTKINLDQQLIAEGTSQLNSEIRVLQAWLAEMDEADKAKRASKASKKAGKLGQEDAEDAEAIAAARKSYSDMLRSRQEILSSLSRQAAQRPVESPAAGV